MEQDNLKKLEEDLKKLSQTVQSGPPVVPPVPVSPIIPPTTTPPIQTPPIPVPPEIKKGSPLSTIAIALVVMAVIAITAYLVGTKFLGQKVVPTPTSTPVVIPSPTSTPDVTANWKTYTHSQLGFSIKYPPEWSIEEQPKFVRFNTLILNEDKKINYFFEVSIDQQTSFDEWTKYESTTRLQPQLVGSVVFEKYIAADLYYSLNYILKQNGKVFRFMTYPYDANTFPKQLGNNIDQLLSTFKFLGASPSSSPSATPSASPQI